MRVHAKRRHPAYIFNPPEYSQAPHPFCEFSCVSTNRLLTKYTVLAHSFICSYNG